MSKKMLRPEQLQQQLSTLVESVEALLAADVDLSDTYYLGLKAKAEQALNSARQALEEDQKSFLARTRHKVKKVNRYVNDCPWRSVALGWAAGMICGIVAAKRQ